jgi:hypothetical protein
MLQRLSQPRVMNVLVILRTASRSPLPKDKSVRNLMLSAKTSPIPHREVCCLCDAFGRQLVSNLNQATENRQFYCFYSVSSAKRQYSPLRAGHGHRSILAYPTWQLPVSFHKSSFCVTKWNVVVWNCSFLFVAVPFRNLKYTTTISFQIVPINPTKESLKAFKVLGGNMAISSFRICSCY